MALTECLKGYLIYSAEYDLLYEIIEKNQGIKGILKVTRYDNA